MNKVYNIIDNIYTKNKSKLEIIHNKIKKYKNTKKYNLNPIILKIDDYILYKLKNKEFYQQNASNYIKNKIYEIMHNSLTDKIAIDKLEKLKNEKNISFIDKELIDSVIKLEKISFYLNAQNFEQPQKMVKTFYTNKYKLNFLIKNLNYSDFTSLLASIKWFYKKDFVEKNIKARLIYHPEEKLTPTYSLLLKKYNLSKDFKIKDKLVDLIAKMYLKLFNRTLSYQDLIDMDNYNGNLQYLSDKGIFLINLQKIFTFCRKNKIACNYLSKKYPLFKWIKNNPQLEEKILDNIMQTGKKIIKNNKYYVNGYSLIITAYFAKNDIKNGCKYWLLSKQNFIGDKQKKESIFKNYDKICGKQ